MVSGKARFLGKGVDRFLDWRFSGSVRERIGNVCPVPHAEADEEWGEIGREIWGQKIGEVPTHSADYFIEAIEREARWAKHELGYLSCEGDKQDILAELSSLLTRAESLKDDFRRLSPDVDRLFFPEAEPRLHADYLEMVCKNIESVLVKSKAMSRKESSQVSRRKIAVELAIRALRIANKFGMKVTATAHPKDYWFSDAVELMVCIGKAIDLDLKKTTWRDIIISAQKAASDLKHKKQ